MSVDNAIDQFPLPPLAEGLPILGNTLAMRQDLGAFFLRQYKQLGSIFRARAFKQEFVVLAGAQANTFVSQQGAEIFRSPKVWKELGHELGNPYGILAIDGEPHTQLRKVLKPAYSANHFLSDIPLMTEIAQNVLNRFQVGEEVSVLHLFRLIITEQLGRALANHAPGENLQHTITTIRIAIKVYLTRQMPAFMLKSPSYQRAKRHFLQMGHEIVAEHRATTREKKDLVDDILAASQKPDFQTLLGSEEQIVFTALGPFIAGVDTVANESTFMLYELLNHPDILAQCVAEADQFFSQGLPTAEQIRAHGVLRRAMMETIRLHPISVGIKSTATRDFAFAGHRVKKEQDIVTATTVSHFQPELFPNPYVFDIERYSEERREHKQRGAYMPFGIGAHSCLGTSIAEAMIPLLMATLLHTVRLKRVHPEARLRVKNDPIPTFGQAFRVSFCERRT